MSILERCAALIKERLKYKPTMLIFHPHEFRWVSDEYAVDDRRYREAEHIASGQIIVVDCGPLSGEDEE